MPVQILNRPYAGLTPKITPVYNGIAFTLDSTLKLKPNFKYIAEIYVDNNKVTELRHHPDISHDNKGVFEVGRVIENFIGYDIELQSNAGTYNGERTNRRYYVEFGEEYSSANPIIKVTPNDSTSFRIYSSDSAAFNIWNVGNYVLIGGSDVSSYNGWAKITSISGNSAIVTGLGPFTTTPSYLNMYYYQGYSSTSIPTGAWGYQNVGGTNFLTLCVSTNNVSGSTGYDRVKLYVGNKVIIKQTSAGTQQVGQQYYENNEFTITSKTITNVGGQACVRLRFDAPYAGVMPAGIIGTVITKDNVVNKGQASTSGDLSYTFNGALQYQEYLDWTPTPYLWNGSTSKFLTKRPDSLKTINVCGDEHWTLTTFGTAQNAGSTNYKVQTETWSTTLPYGATGSMSTGTYGWRISIPTSVASSYNIGDYVTITSPSNGTRTGQVATKSVSGSTTFISINSGGAPIVETGTITRNIAVKYYNLPVQGTSTIQACGPKNYKQSAYAEFLNGSCYKYFVRIVGNSITSTPWNPYSVQKSETWTFNISCDCSTKTKYKLMWLNELGGWDFYTFDLGSNKSLVIEKSIYQKKLKEIKSNNAYTYTQGNRGRTTYDTKSTLNYVVRSNFLTQEKIEWLSWLYESPEVYWIDETNNKLHPIVVKATNVDIPNKQNAGDAGHLYIYTVEFETAYDRTIQRGGDIQYVAQSTNTPGVGGNQWGDYSISYY
jgi:hypothetical protein